MAPDEASRQLRAKRMQEGKRALSRLRARTAHRYVSREDINDLIACLDALAIRLLEAAD